MTRREPHRLQPPRPIDDVVVIGIVIGVCCMPFQDPAIDPDVRQRDPKLLGGCGVKSEILLTQSSVAAVEERMVTLMGQSGLFRPQVGLNENEEPVIHVDCAAGWDRDPCLV